MRTNALLLFFSMLGAYIVAGSPFALSSEIDVLIESVENDIKKWQITRASDSISQALEIDGTYEEKYRTYYLKSLVDFYRGDYSGAEEYGQKALKNKELKEETPFLHYIVKASKEGPQFNEIKSEHFVIRYAHPKDIILAEYAKDVLEKSRFEIGLDLETYPEDPIIVEIYPDMESFTLSSTLPPENVEKTGVVGICKFNRIMILSPRLLPKGYSWADTLAHEYVHYLVFLKSENTVPVWLHEGIAKYEEKRWKEKERKVISPFYETILTRALNDNKLVPIEKMHPSLAMLESAREAQLAFAQSGTIVSYLVDNWGQDALINLINSIKETNDYKAAIEEVTELEFPLFYDSWEKDLRSRNLEEKIPDIRIKGVRIKNKERKSHDGSEDLIDIDNNKARDYTRLGDLLKLRGRLSPATYEYEKALEYDPYSPIISSRLASTLNIIGDTKRAREVLSPILDFYPNHIDIHMILGRIYLDEGNLSKAEEEYLTAVSINPFDPEVHASLIVLYEKQGQTELLEREEKFLRILLNEETENAK
ncbi:MAG: tetratricopeptide repeat protein [Candidatus Dadabacteria bacterium]|nr:tetratricopeptide repeat protein [Candidatus Dadabacteria bacterium]